MQKNAISHREHFLVAFWALLNLIDQQLTLSVTTSVPLTFTVDTVMIA